MSKAKIICCACLNSSPDVTYDKLIIKDINEVDLLTKLQFSIPQIKWQPSFHICLVCAMTLETVYTFHITCLKSQEIRENKTGTLRKRRSKNNTVLKNQMVNIVKLNTNIKTENAIIKQENVEPIEPIDNINFNESNDEDSEENNSTEDIKNEDDNTEGYCSSQDIKNDTEHENIDKIKTGLQKIKHKPEKGYRKRVYSFTCEQCSFTSSYSTKLIEHSTAEHGMEAKDVKPFSCDRCPSKFTSSSNLLQHQKYHEEKRSKVCTYCGKGFYTKTDLTTHEKHHLNKREYSCDECGKCFNTHKDVRSHKLVVHTDSSLWKYACEVCAKRFPIKSNYDSHMRRHAGEKNFQCQLCNRKFTDKCVMQRHMKTHSNVRDYRCKECGKEYKDQRVMRVHMAKIHQIGLGDIKLPSKERRHQCHICPKAYYAKNKLTRHLLVHSGEKPYACTICNKKFNDNSYVKQHLKKTHGIEGDAAVTGIKFEEEENVDIKYDLMFVPEKTDMAI